MARSITNLDEAIIIVRQHIERSQEWQRASEAALANSIGLVNLEHRRVMWSNHINAALDEQRNLNNQLNVLLSFFTETQR